MGVHVGRFFRVFKRNGNTVFGEISYILKYFCESSKTGFCLWHATVLPLLLRISCAFSAVPIRVLLKSVSFSKQVWELIVASLQVRFFSITFPNYIGLLWHIPEACEVEDGQEQWGI